MTKKVISLASRRDKNADRYENIDCEILDIARLVDLAVATHFREAHDEHAISDFGTTTDLILGELQCRTTELAGRLWGRPGDGDPAA